MKRKLSLICAVAVVMSLFSGLSVSAAKNLTPNGNLNERHEIQTLKYAGLGDYLGDAAVDPEHTNPGNEIIIPLLREGFEDENDALVDWVPGTNLGPSVGDLHRSNISVHYNIIQGREFIKDIKLVTFKPTPRLEARSAIRIRFIDEWISTEEFDYQFRVGLCINGKSSEVSETFHGRFSNPFYEAYSKDYIYVGDSMIIDARNSVDDLQADLGNGVTAYIDVIKGQKYFAIAEHFGELSNSKKREGVFAQYPSIFDAYHIKSVNLKPTYTHIKIDGYDVTHTAFVYGTDGKFVGMAHEELPFSTRYYLSSKEIDIDAEFIKKEELERYEDRTGEVVPELVKEFTAGLKEAQKLPGRPTNDN